MLEIENWSKEQVHTVMRELLFSFNYMWFLMEEWMKRNCPEKLESEDFQKLSEDFGSYEAQRLEKTVDETSKDVDRLVQFLKHSHWCVFEDIELTKLSDKRLRMRTLGCSAQKAAKKWGMDHYDCAKSALRLRKGFFARIDPTAQVAPAFTPPDQKPAGTPSEVTCEWIISIE
jgi:hypothetical protein